MKREPPWKTLALELAREGVDSRYITQLRRKVDVEQELTDLQKEIAGEIARALGRTEDGLLVAMAELELRGAQLARLRAQGAGAHDITSAIDAFNSQRVVAEKKRRDLVIHREAAGFRRNQVIYDEHPLPPRAR